MGKSGGGVSDWHRQKRKKEQQKNKTQRISARDERVRSEKTVAQVQEEIRTLERQHKNEETRPHHVKSKLDRLRKELKIVQQEQEEKATVNASQSSSSGYNVPGAHSQQQAPSFQPLENPAVSVYHDAVLNPFGAPPPGKPRLYHRRGDGVTMNLAEAWVPGQPEPPPPMPPPPPPPRQQQAVRPPPPPPTMDSRHTKPPWQPGVSHTNVPAPPPPLRPSTPPPSPRESSRLPSLSPQQQQQQQPLPIETQKIKKIIDPYLDQPALPQPSAAVLRSRTMHTRATNNKDRLADIWASAEEIEYEQAAGGSLEGATAAVSTWWYYQDRFGQVQGPYTVVQILEWIGARYFGPQTMVRPADEASETTGVSDGENTTTVTSMWKYMEQVNDFQTALQHLQRQAIQPKQVVNSSLGRMTFENDVSSASVTDRVALQAQHDKGLSEIADAEQAQDEGEVDVDDSVQARIAALRAQRLREMEEEDDPSERFAQQVQDENNDNQQQEVMNQNIALDQPQDGGNVESEGGSIQARIAALRADYVRPPPSADADLSSARDRVMARIMSLRAQRDHSSAETLPIPPPPPPPSTSLGFDLPVPPRPPPMDGSSGANGHNDLEIPSYPIPDNVITAPYPSDEGEVGPDPLVGDDVTAIREEQRLSNLNDDGIAKADLSLPTGLGVTYSAASAEELSYLEDGDFPVTDAYPTEEGDDLTEDKIQHLGGLSTLNETVSIKSPPKKRVKVDRELIAMLPSHIQKKRLVATPNKSNGKNHPVRPRKDLPSSERPPTPAQDDNDYELFMKEIEGL